MPERAELSRFIKGLASQAPMRPKLEEDLLESLTALSEKSAIVDFSLQRDASGKGYEVVVHRTSQNVAKGLLELAEAIDIKAVARAGAAHIARETASTDTLLASLSTQNRAVLEGIITLANAKGLTGDSALAAACGLSVTELTRFFAGEAVHTGKGDLPVVLGLLRFMTRHTEGTSFTAAQLSALAASLTPPIEKGPELHPAFAAALACLGSAEDIALATSVIRARVFSSEIDDSRFSSSIGASRSHMHTYLSSPGSIVRQSATALTAKLLNVSQHGMLPPSWWQHSTLDRAACKALHDRWLAAHNAAAKTDDADGLPRPHVIDARTLFACVPPQDIPVAHQLLGALEGPGMRPDKWLCSGILGVTGNELDDIVRGKSVATRVSAHEFLTRCFTFFCDRELSGDATTESQWRAVFAISQPKLREAAQRFRDYNASNG